MSHQQREAAPSQLPADEAFLVTIALGFPF